jgi:glycosyltransferase involved in cell wall biosynthesis
MRIAEISPPWFAVPPTGYGGIESVVHTLTEALVERGHEVTLFAARGSRSSACLVCPTEPPASLADPNAAEIEWAYVERAYREAASFDVIHDHTRVAPSLAAARAGAGDAALPSVVHTLHGMWTPEARARYERLDDVVHLVAISDAQRIANPSLKYAGRVHNGVDLRCFPYEEDKDPYLAFVGRASAEKGPDRAIRAARLAGSPIKMMVKRLEPPELDYWDRVVVPMLGEDVEVVPSEAGAARKVELLCRARATLFPVAWPEPFGMVMIESMACGTPVLATPVGAVPEVVADGVTGFWCSNVHDMAEAVEHLSELSPADCRRRVAERFSKRTLVEGYEGIFGSVVERGATTERPLSLSSVANGAPSATG